MTILGLRGPVKAARSPSEAQVTICFSLPSTRAMWKSNVVRRTHVMRD